MSAFATVGLGAVLAWASLALLGAMALSRSVFTGSHERALVVALAASAFVGLMPFARALVEPLALEASLGPAATGAPGGALTLPQFVVAAERSTSFLGLAGILLVVAACGALGRLGLEHVRLRKLVVGAVPAPARVRNLLADIGRDMGVGCPPVLVSVEARVPLTAGVLRPAILLPRLLCDELGAGDLTFVLRHELAHAARRDVLRGALTSVLAAPFVGHPLRSRIRDELVYAREAAVDRLAAGPQITEYARVLLDVAAWHRRQRAFEAAPAMAQRALRRRLEALAMPMIARRKRVVPLLATAATLAVTALLWPACNGSVDPDSGALSPSAVPPAARDVPHTPEGFGDPPAGPEAPHTPEDFGVGPPRFQGALPASAVKEVISQNRNQIRSCYEDALARNPQLGGRVVVSWVIGATGQVTSANVSESTLGNADLEACITGRILAWKFPPPNAGGTVTVDYPFILRAY